MSARTVATAAVAALDAAVVAAIRNNPRAGAATELGLSVEALDTVPSRGSDGWCDGASFVDDGRIMYRPSAGLRENFTICHEIGHPLLRVNDDAMDWVYDQHDPNNALEELCDKFAAQILVPPTLVDHVIDESGYGASAVVELYDRTEASRHCCAVALVERLPCKGFVAIVNPDTGIVWAAARQGDTSPTAWHGQPVPASHQLRRLKDKPKIRVRSWWPLGQNERWIYYLNAVRHDHWNIGVFAEDDLWGIDKLHFSQEERNRYDGSVSCPCGYVGDTPWFPCNDCNTSQCPKCRKCQCDWRATREKFRRCENCTSSVRTHLLVDGLCDRCR